MAEPIQVLFELILDLAYNLLRPVALQRFFRKKQTLNPISLIDLDLMAGQSVIFTVAVNPKILHNQAIVG